MIETIEVLTHSWVSPSCHLERFHYGHDGADTLLREAKLGGAFRERVAQLSQFDTESSKQILDRLLGHRVV